MLSLCVLDKQLEIPQARGAAHVAALIEEPIGAARSAIQIDFDPQQVAEQRQIVITVTQERKEPIINALRAQQQSAARW